ncbi:hypothetical protein [Actinomadura sp. 9N215]|uniref:hypothetical protein n=1 Tax=Actinomadura sp. 9N215 TaxID=3375150 RepID=UPI0037884839
MSCPQHRPLLTTRAAVIFLTAFVVGCGAAALTFWATGSVPEALLVAGGALGGAIGLLNQIIKAETDGPSGNHVS